MCYFTADEIRMMWDPAIKGFGCSTVKRKLDILFQNTVKFPRRPVGYDNPLYAQLIWGKILSGGEDARALIKEFGHTDKSQYESNIKLSLEERLNGVHYDEPMVYCHWCATIGLPPIHPRSKVTTYKGPEIFQYECIYMRKYKNSIRTKEQLDKAYDGGFLEWLMRKVRIELGETNLLYESDIRKYTFNLYENSCVVCGIDDSLQGDHIKPRSLFWPLTIHNCIPLCAPHNLEKLDALPHDYFGLEELERISKISNITIDELCNVGYNYEIVDWLVSNENIVNEWVNQRGKKEQYAYILKNMISKALKLKPNDLYNI